MDNLYQTICDESPLGFVVVSMHRDNQTERFDYALKTFNKAFLKCFPAVSPSAGSIQRYFDNGEGLFRDFKSHLNQVVSTGEILELETYVDDQKLWLKLRFQLLDDQNIMVSISEVLTPNNDTETISETDRQFRTLLDQLSSIAVQGYTYNGTVIYWNKASELLYGYSEEEALGKNVNELIVPDVLHGIVSSYIEGMLMTGKAISSEELVLKDKNGEPVVIFSNYVILRNSDGQRELFCMDIDLSELKLKNTMLNMLSVATSQSPATIVITDAEGNIQYVNSKFCELTGYPLDEVLGKNPRMLKSDKTDPELHKQLWLTISAGDEWHGEFINRKRNGELYYESAVIAPIKNDFGKITNFIAVKEDITGRVLAQRSVMEHSNNLAGLLEVSRTFSSTLELEELLLLVAQKGVELINVSSGGVYLCEDDMLILQSAWPIPNFELPENVKNIKMDEHPYIDRCLNSGEPLAITHNDFENLTSHEINVIKSLGVEVLLYVPLIRSTGIYGILVLAGQEKSRVFTQADMDFCQTMAAQASLAIENARLYYESKKNNKTLEQHNLELESLNKEFFQAKEKAEESDRLKTAFLQNMSHEIRTPMNGILGFSELLRTSGLSEQRKEAYLGFITNSTSQLLSIVDDIIDISRLEAGDLVLHNDSIQITDILNNIFNEYKNKTESGVHLKLMIPEKDQDIVLEGDAQRLQKVIRKLMCNAVKFTRKGHIGIGFEKRIDEIMFFVEDTGIGVSEDLKEHIFKPFCQADMKVNREFGGNGLGLTIAARIVEKMGARIILESAPGKGSKFYFTLPLKKENHQQVEMKKALTSLYTKEYYNLLVAEDDDINFILIRDALKDSPSGDKMELLRAKNGKEAVEMFLSHGFIDLILMDVKMPVMDGLEATGIIKKEDERVPVIAQTAFALSQDQKKAIEAGCDDYLTKPLDINDLLQKVYHFLQLPFVNS